VCSNLVDSQPDQAGLDEALSVFTGLRPRLFSIAYRMLGSAPEAEDVVQEVWLRWQKTDRSAVVSPVGFLSIATSRLAINATQSAWARRNHTGPMPLELVGAGGDPEEDVLQAEQVERALLLVMERLTPTERAVYLLREAFEYTYNEIADILRTSAVNVRKIASRARHHLQAEPRKVVDTVEHRRLREAFVAAARSGNVAGLEALLAPRGVGWATAEAA